MTLRIFLMENAKGKTVEFRTRSLRLVRAMEQIGFVVVRAEAIQAEGEAC